MEGRWAGREGKEGQGRGGRKGSEVEGWNGSKVEGRARWEVRREVRLKDEGVVG